MVHNQIADTVGVPRSTFQRIRKTNQSKRDVLQLQGESNDGTVPTGTLFSQVVKSKG